MEPIKDKMAMIKLLWLLLVKQEHGQKLESDGDQKIKQVTFDPANQRMIIGDDVQIYTVNGNQITVDDTDLDPSDRIVLSK